MGKGSSTPQIHCKYDELVPLNELKPHPKNRNEHPKDQVERLAYLMREHGVRAPIVVAKKPFSCIAKGHGTTLAFEENGWKKVPVVYQDFESEEMLYAYVQSDNAIQTWADLDIKSIGKDFEEYRLYLDPDLLGIKDFQPPTFNSEVDEDEIPPIPSEPVTHFGDLFMLGNHRLLCGDSTDSTQVERLMNNETARMVFTDPPYNLASDSKLLAARGLRDSYDKLKESKWDYDFVFENSISSFETVLNKNSSVYICTSHFLFGKIQEWLVDWADITNYVVWAKPNPMPSLAKRHWTWSSELICYGTKGKHTFNFPDSGHALNVWNINKNQNNDLHPTMKPVGIPEHAINHSSKPNDLVVDLFLGSGSTLIACEKTNRRCYSMEIDPHYCDVAIARWEKFTNQKAILVK